MLLDALRDRLADPTAPSFRLVGEAIVRGKLDYRPFELPPGFDMRDHDARVAAFHRAFVASVTGSPADYEIARMWVVDRFGRA